MQLLFNIAHLVLVTAHSNAGIELVYALRITLKVQTDAGWISNGLCFQSLQSSLLNQKLFSSAMTLNLMKIFCMMLKKQQESITRCTLQFEFLQMLHNTAINIIFWLYYWMKTSLSLSNQLLTREPILQHESKAHSN